MAPNDDLSAQEEQQIGTELGVTADLGGTDAYLLLKVPDFGDTSFVNAAAADAVTEGIDPSGIQPGTLQSFLRLGAFDYAAEPPAAKELLKVIPKANPASNPTQADPGTTIFTGASGLVFVDDVRVRPQDVTGLTTADDHGHGLTLTERRAESEKLYRRGGWRDHSDGNRITTTWGDKVEVIRGNYKMIVLGRQNDPGLAMGWEASGSHIQDYAPGTMPGASYWLEWIKDPRYQSPADPNGDGRKGVWLLVNTTENVYEYARKSGNFREEVWGDVHESYVGSENPPDAAFGTNHDLGTHGHEPPTRLDDRSYDLPGTASNSGRSQPPWTEDNLGMVRSNPHIIEKVWAKRIDSWTGSSACRVPFISEKTWADDAEDSTDVLNDVTSTTIVGGKVTETTTVTGAVASTTSVGGAMAEATSVGGAMSSVTNVAATIAEATNAGTIFESTITGAHGELEINAGHLAIEISAVGGIEIALMPLKMSIDTGRGLEICMDRKEIHLGKDDTAFSWSDWGIDMKSVSLTKKDTALKIVKGALSVMLGI